MSDAPSIPRYWWLKRLTILISLVVVGVGVSHWVLWRWADGRLASQRVEWIAAGNPDPRDARSGMPPPLQGEDNAAVLVVEAIAKLAEMTPEQNEHWYNFASWAFPPAPKQLEAVRGIVEQDRPAVMTFRGVYERPRTDWGVDAVAIDGLLPRLNDARHLADNLSWGLQVHHHDGEIAEALRYAKDLTWLGMAIVDDGPVLVTSLVSAGIEAMAIRGIETDLLARRPAGMSAQEERAAWREARPQVLEIIALLLDEEYEKQLVSNGFRGEWSSAYSVRRQGRGWWLADRNFLTAPFFDAQLADHLEQIGRLADIAEQAESFAHLSPHIPPPKTGAPVSLAGTTTEAIILAMDPSFGRAAPRMYQVRTDRRMGAILLGMKLYEAEHDGRLPVTLEELVPDYLPHIPLDPNAGGGPVPFDADRLRKEITGITPATKPATQPAIGPG